MCFPECISAGIWDWNRAEPGVWPSQLSLLLFSTQLLLSVMLNSLLPSQKQEVLLIMLTGPWERIWDSSPVWPRMLNSFLLRLPSHLPSALILICFSPRFPYSPLPFLHTFYLRL